MFFKDKLREKENILTNKNNLMTLQIGVESYKVESVEKKRRRCGSDSKGQTFSIAKVKEKRYGIVVFGIGLLRIVQATCNKLTSRQMNAIDRYFLFGCYFESMAALFSLV